jgi:hypothetical protein
LNDAARQAQQIAKNTGGGSQSPDGAGQKGGQGGSDPSGGPGGGAGMVGAGGPGTPAAGTEGTMKREVVKGEKTPGGRILSSTFVKTDKLDGTSKIQVTPAELDAIHQQSPDEVSEENVSKDAQKAIKQYFDSLRDGK